MNRIFYSVVVMVSLLALRPAAPAYASEVIDGVIATVNRQPIFQSDWDEAICFEAFMQQKPLKTLTQEDRVNALRRLIDRQLLKAQMAGVSYVQPSEAELRDSLSNLRAGVPGIGDDKAWQDTLSSYALTEKMVKDHLKNEIEVMNFVEVRLRPNVHVQPEEVEAYYRKELLPELERSGSKSIALNEAEPRIRELLTQQRMDELLDAWLHNLRQQSEIQSTVPLPERTPVQPASSASGLN